MRKTNSKRNNEEERERRERERENILKERLRVAPLASAPTISKPTFCSVDPSGLTQAWPPWPPLRLTWLGHLAAWQGRMAPARPPYTAGRLSFQTDVSFQMTIIVAYL